MLCDYTVVGAVEANEILAIAHIDAPSKTGTITEHRMYTCLASLAFDRHSIASHFRCSPHMRKSYIVSSHSRPPLVLATTYRNARFL